MPSKFQFDKQLEFPHEVKACQQDRAGIAGIPPRFSSQSNIYKKSIILEWIADFFIHRGILLNPDCFFTKCISLMKAKSLLSKLPKNRYEVTSL